MTLFFNRILFQVIVLVALVSNDLLSATQSDSLFFNPDTSAFVSDEREDSIYISDNDTLSAPSDTVAKKSSAITDPVKYKAKDSIYFSLEEQKVYLYGDAEVYYQDIELKAAYIEFGMSDKIVYAAGVYDSATATYIGKPVFKDKDEEFESFSMTYNFETKQGVIREVITAQEGGYIHGTKIKRHANEHIHMKNGKYTTCDHEHPHYYLMMTKAEIIPNDKIVAGPSYVVVEDIPIYILGLPFAFLPNTKGAKSGVIIPDYGEEVNRGFFLRNGGYYFAISDYVDLKVLGDIYTNGTWGASMLSRYKKRYKYDGYFAGSFYENKSGEEGLDLTNQKDIKINWRHAQDPKANPYSKFDANVDFSTTSFDQNQSYNYNYVNNTKTSNVSYYKQWAGKPFNLSANVRHSQNSQTQTIDFKAPQLAFRVNRFYPLKSKKSIKERWYESIQMDYSADYEQNIHTYDSILFKPNGFDDRNNGFKHRIPVSMVIKPFNNFNITPSVNYEGLFYPEYVEKEMIYLSESQKDTLITHLYKQSIYGQSISPSISASYNPRMYGMYQMANPNSKIEAIRHVIMPSAGVSFSPDMSKIMTNYFRDTDINGDTISRYSTLERGIYGTPQIPYKNGSVSLALKNNLEMKIKQPTDTAMNYKKIKLLDRFDISTSYKMPFEKERDTMNWSNIRVYAATQIFKNSMNIVANADYDPYVYTKLGENRFSRLAQFEWDHNKRLGRLVRFNTSIDFDLNNDIFKPKDEPKEAETKRKIQRTDYNYFDIPWSLRFGYNFMYSQPYDKTSEDITQALSFSGNFSLTQNWRIDFNSGYDFLEKQLTYTNLTITRDLHCWEMSLNMSPFGDHRFYYFRINVKAGQLSDLKYEKRKTWYDY